MFECGECGKPAVWVRHTLFAGSYYYCARHAEKQKNLGKHGDSHFFWERIASDKKSKKKHSIKVAGYDGSFQELAKAIFQMRYDKTGEFLRCCAVELRRQAKDDRKKGRRQLANILDGAANAEERQRKRFLKIYRLCAPYMKNELG